MLSDALARWVQLELVCGPYKKDELPWVSLRGGELFLDAKIAPVSIVIKVDGVNGRVIVDGSFPHAKGEVDVNGQVPLSGNAGINADDFPAPTDGMGHILDLMWRACPGCCFTKADWPDAYKHIHVREEDVRLQVMQWGAIFFVGSRPFEDSKGEK